MIKRIGFKRSALIIALAGILGVIVFFNYVVFKPKLEASLANLSSVSAEVNTLSTDVATMRSNMEAFEKKRQLFDTITNTGFFNNQERVSARERFDAIQKLSNVISARYEIRAASITDDDTVKDTDYVIVQTPVSINLNALTDIDIYRFIYYLNYAHPGNVGISSIVVNRNGVVDQESLREIGTGRPRPIVTATIEFTWTTMASRVAMLLPPRNAAPDTEDGQAASGQTDVPAGEPQI